MMMNQRVMICDDKLESDDELESNELISLMCNFKLISKIMKIV